MGNYVQADGTVETTYQHPPRGGVWTLRGCLVAPFTIHLAPLGVSKYTVLLGGKVFKLEFVGGKFWGVLQGGPKKSHQFFQGEILFRTQLMFGWNNLTHLWKER